MLIVVMGVAGSGKTTIGSMLAEALRCEFLEGDSLHPPSNIEKMRRGAPLTDADRVPWLAAIHARLVDASRNCRSIVAASSALRASHRAAIAANLPVIWVHLRGPEELIRARLEQRTGHFFRADLLESQVEALQEPWGAIVADISMRPDEIVNHLLAELPVNPDVRIFETITDASRALAESVAATIRNIVDASGRCSVALSGGSTPRKLHRLLATEYRDRIPWADVHVFWGDERYVPHDHPQSNYGMARDTLLAHVPCPPENIHPMPTQFEDPEAAARDYEGTLRGYFGDDTPRIDVNILGMGPDGHTASLFPGHAALEERSRWVAAITAPAEPPTRLTLTLPVLVRGRHTHLLVEGSTKAHAVRCVLSRSGLPATMPAAAILDAEGGVTWWLDRQAASEWASTKPEEG